MIEPTFRAPTRAASLSALACACAGLCFAIIGLFGAIWIVLSTPSGPTFEPMKRVQWEDVR